jgi:hypothetical protein
MARKRKQLTEKPPGALRSAVAAAKRGGGTITGRTDRTAQGAAQHATAQALAKRASVGGATKTGNVFTEGKRKGDRAQAVQQFQEKFKNADVKTRHKMVGQVMGKKFGTAPWQKQVYGKDFKPGTVGKLNEKVGEKRDLVKELKGKERALRSQASSASTDTKSAIEQRLSKLEQNTSTVKKNLFGTKQSRDKFIDLRDKAMQGIVAQAKTNPKLLAEARKRLVRKKLKARPKGTSVA